MTMTKRFFGQVLLTEQDETTTLFLSKYEEAMKNWKTKEAIEVLFSAVDACNQALNLHAPWTMMKTDELAARAVFMNIWRMMNEIITMSEVLLPEAAVAMKTMMKTAEPVMLWERIEADKKD
jgi:methionyl-tRNA synthetase